MAIDEARMKSIVFDEFGGADVLRIAEKPIPVAKDGHVVVKVWASPINPTDLMMRDGRQAKMMTEVTPPYTPGFEFSGHVHSIGKGVTGLNVGQPVMGILNARRQAGGAQAEYVSVNAASVAPLDPGVDLVLASTIPLNGLTARMALEKLALPAGSALLVTGGAGAVASYVIDLAKAKGLIVVTDAKPSDFDLVRAAGADTVVTRGEGMVDEVLRHYPSGVDGLIDTALIGNEASAAVREGGPAVTLRASHPITNPKVRGYHINVFTQDTNTPALVWLAELLRGGQLKPRIAKRLRLADVAKAHRLLADGGLHGGRVVLLTDEALSG
jgi:NADPH:quinone reductase